MIPIQLELEHAKKILEDTSCDEPQASAELLCAAVLKCSPQALFFHKQRAFTKGEKNMFSRYIAERTTGKPVAYILGVQNFRGLDFFVNEHVLIPRPETEEMIDYILPYQGEQTLCIDLGTGSGVLPISAGKEGIWQHIIALEKSPEALHVAKINAHSLGVSVDFVCMNVVSEECSLFLQQVLTSYIPEQVVITANLPYISLLEKNTLDKEVTSFEPHMALFGGNRGDELILKSSKIICALMKKLQIPFFFLHELDDQMVSTTKKSLETETLFEWKIKSDLQNKERFLYTNTILY